LALAILITVSPSVRAAAKRTFSVVVSPDS